MEYVLLFFAAVGFLCYKLGWYAIAWVLICVLISYPVITDSYKTSCDGGLCNL